MEKFVDRLCVACTLTIPREGKTAVRLANFSEKAITLKPGKTVGQFHPLDRVHASVNSFQVDADVSEDSKSSKANQGNQAKGSQ